MVEEGRRLECRHCGLAVWICRRCDRGHRYCSSACRQAARRSTSGRARRRYQAKSAGRSGNARRQREWYWRQRSSPKSATNLTHHSSTEAVLCLMIAPATADRGVAVLESTEPLSTETLEIREPAISPTAGDVPSGVHHCVVCRRLCQSQSPTEPNEHGSEKTDSQS